MQAIVPRPVLCVFAALAAATTQGGTFIQLDLGTDAAADLEFTGGAGGVLRTLSDGNGGTTGDQNTRVTYMEFLAGEPAIVTPTASFTMNGVTAVGTANVIGGTLVQQEFAGGTLALYAPDNTLLLSGMLATSRLVGDYGAPATGSTFSTTFNLVTGGTLAPQIDPDSLLFSVVFTGVNGQAGMSVTPAVPDVFPPPPIHVGALNAFTATVAEFDIGGDPGGGVIPEPAGLALSVIGGWVAAASRRHKRRE